MRGRQGVDVRTLLMLLPILAGAGSAAAADVLEAIEVPHAPAAVWTVVGPWCAPADWHPAVRACEELELGGRLHRRLALVDGSALLERVLARDETALTYRYALERGPLPIRRLRAELRVEPAATGTRVSWRADVEAAPEMRDDVLARLAAFYREGLAGLRAALEP